LAHEFLDALPVHQLSRVAAGPQGWRERMVELPEHVRAGEAAEAETERAGDAGEAAVLTGDAGAVGATAEAAAVQRARQRGSEAAEAERAEEEAEAAGEARRHLELVLSRSRTPAAQLYGPNLGAELQEAEVGHVS
jgi:SAM-dependent MidA family methyltransferase